MNINELLTQPESNIFDRKSVKYKPVNLANDLIAFANADGGTVVVGVNDKKVEDLSGMNPVKLNDYKQIGLDFIKPKLDVNVKMETVTGGKKILLLSVEPSPDTLFTNMKDEVYLRVGDESRKVTYEQRIQLEYDRGIRAYETQPVAEALLEDLNSEALSKYKENNNFQGEDIWKLLFSRGLAKRTTSEEGTKYHLTVAGVILLADEPTTFIAGARVRFMRYDGTAAQGGEDMNIIKMALVEGPLDNVLQEVVNLVGSQLRTFTRLNGETGKFEETPEYPYGAWLEGIVNAVAHRAYNLHGDDIRIIMYDDRLQIHSPGALPSVVTIENMRDTHYSRNPYIARALTELGWVREFGEGVDRIYNDMAEYFLDEPEYQVTENSTDLILRNNIMVRGARRDINLSQRFGSVWDDLNYVDRKIVEFAYEKGYVRTRDMVDENTSSDKARRAMKKLVKMGILERKATAPNDPTQFYVLKD